ncbi:hypothetical protein [Winogradskyella alexanderae]|uniref:Outer membrane beta-barrel porin/alpha-amylase n=1 Tax=Winogradskyella alexanderae TaxID=2877123 RepID=A0ABS7XTG3_9FLAO|nr:hypothetical protein [Winogradskyella alexanderae]MCA0133324.1 hypothetical protein [Winogradskyella alexanderae]
MFRRSTLSLAILLWMFCFVCLGQQAQDSTKLETLRTQSGVDPTRVVTKLVYSIWYYDKSDNRAQINNRLNFTIGVNRWSFALKPEIITLNNGLPSGTFETKAGDLRFSILNAFYVKGKHALAGAAEFTLPTGPLGFGSQYFSVNPSLTYSYTINSSLFFAIQPQYLFHLSRNIDFPALSVFTIRTFLAKFMSSGWFFVFEPRIINDFENNNFDLVFSPIIGKSLGGGFNITSVAEFPIKRETLDNRGLLISFGITKNF